MITYPGMSDAAEELLKTFRREMAKQGGLARSQKLTAAEKSAIAKKASRARWKKYRAKKTAA